MQTSIKVTMSRKEYNATKSLFGKAEKITEALKEVLVTGEEGETGTRTIKNIVEGEFSFKADNSLGNLGYLMKLKDQLTVTLTVNLKQNIMLELIDSASEDVESMMMVMVAIKSMAKRHIRMAEKFGQAATDGSVTKEGYEKYSDGTESDLGKEESLEKTPSDVFSIASIAIDNKNHKFWEECVDFLSHNETLKSDVPFSHNWEETANYVIKNHSRWNDDKDLNAAIKAAFKS